VGSVTCKFPWKGEVKRTEETLVTDGSFERLTLRRGKIKGKKQRKLNHTKDLKQGEIKVTAKGFSTCFLQVKRRNRGEKERNENVKGGGGGSLEHGTVPR